MFFRPFPEGFVKIFNFAIFLPFCWQKCNKIPLLYRFVKSNKIDTSNQYQLNILQMLLASDGITIGNKWPRPFSSFKAKNSIESGSHTQWNHI